MSRNGTPMQRLRDRERVSVAPERIAYLKDRGLEVAVEQVEVLAEAAAEDAAEAIEAAEDAQDTVDGALDGTTAFTAVNVGGTIVAENAGLADEIVTTPAIAVDDVSGRASAYTEANLAWSGSGYDVAQTVSLTTTGAPVDVDWGVIFDGSGASGFNGVLAVERDGVAIWGPYNVAEASYNSATFSMLATLGQRIPDHPAAGSHTWELLVSYSGAGGARNFRSRSLLVREHRTES